MNYHPLLQGAIEMHCHAAPSVFDRKQTDAELIADIKAAGMVGVVIKSHESSTVDRTAVLRQYNSDLHIYGGLALNHFTGGLSPAAVEAAIQLGARIIWMPTISSAQHLQHFKGRKTTLFKGSALSQPQKGLTIWDQQQHILPDVQKILKLIAEANIILATGHVSPEECMALVPAARQAGVQKILIQHADLGIAPLTLEQQLELAGQGAFIEKCYLAAHPDQQDITLAALADSIRAIGPERCVMVTDYGQAHNKPVVEALSDFVTAMLAEGLAETDIRQMLVANPRQLLNI